MWYLWTTLLVSSALVAAGGAGEVTTATTRAPPRTLDRQAAELAWRSWLQSPESGNQNAPPRRIITKSLFITPLVCPKGQRLDGRDCVQVLTVSKEDHERILLERLNSLFTAAPSDVTYDYGDEEPGPLQLSIPINFNAQAEPLHAPEPSAQAQELHGNFIKIDKKPDDKAHGAGAASLEAELELLRLKDGQRTSNDTTSEEGTDILNHNVLQAMDKPKRDSPINNPTEENENIDSEEGQKEVVYGHVNIDPILLHTEGIIESESEPPTTIESTEAVTEQTSVKPTHPNNVPAINSNLNESSNQPIVVPEHESDKIEISNATTHITLKKEGEKTKLNPENDYSDIGEAIKLISRYAEVTTDDNFSKDQKKYALKDDSILGTRTKLQYRRNKPKPSEKLHELPSPSQFRGSEKTTTVGGVRQNEVYYRYPWQGQHSPKPPSDYPFRHIQDYWPGYSHVGGVYNTAHENPRRHHHTYPHNYYYRPRGYVNYPVPYPGLQPPYAAQVPFARQAATHYDSAIRYHSNNRDLYSLLGLRHWFSSEATSKR